MRKSARFIAQCLKEAQSHLRHGDTGYAAELLDRMNGSAPHDPGGLGLYGRLLHECGRPAAAVPVLERAIQLAPGDAAHWCNLGAAREATGDVRAALESYRQAIALNPSSWVACFNLGTLLEVQGDYAGAEILQRQCLRNNPEYGPGIAALARLCARGGRLEEAVNGFEKALSVEPTVEVYCNLAQTLTKWRRYPNALAAAREAIRLNSQFAGAWYQAGQALTGMDHVTGARQAYEAALACDPDYADAMEGLATCAQMLADAEEAVRWYVRAMELQPQRIQTHSGLLFTLSSNAAASPDELLEAHRGWAQMHTAHAARFNHSPVASAAERRLRVGFVSGDLREHPVRFFIAPILRGLDRAEFEVICYSNNQYSDAATAQIRALADGWVEIAGASDENAAERIRADSIDILVDLSGHTHGNRLLVFARKPAPIQVCYLGYLGTTGLEEMDYWITDWTVHPTDTAEKTTERIWRLPRCWVAYEPLAATPEVSARASGQPITFASFNALQKLGVRSIALWSRALNALPESRLLIKSHGLDYEEEKGILLRRLSAAGIQSDRVKLMGRLPSREAHLQLFSEIDIALDTTPWAGGTTTAETLWMGVPVVTLPGALMPSRMSASMLRSIGLDNLVARDESDFERIAVELARDGERRLQLRRELRERMTGSPLCDGAELALEIGRAFREMWRTWCGAAAGGQ